MRECMNAARVRSVATILAMTRPRQEEEEFGINSENEVRDSLTTLFTSKIHFLKCMEANYVLRT